MRRFLSSLNWRNRWGRFFRFAVVGVTGTLVYYILLLFLVEALDVRVMLATSVAFAVVVLQNYVLHYAWTFASTAAHHHALPQFVAMSAAGFAINWIIMYGGVSQLGWNYLLVQLVAIGAVVTWNFVVSNVLIFRQRTHAVENATE